jgi:hypothetical protein
MSNPFQNWTPQTAAEHNRRVAEKAGAAIGVATFTPTPGLAPKSGMPVKTIDQARDVVLSNVVYQESTDEKKLNKLEKAWLRELRRLNPPWIGIQCVTLKLADDCRYTPDFPTIDPNGLIVFYETKGFMRDDAAVKIKVAARLFRWAKFVLVTKEKGQWVQKEINA